MDSEKHRETQGDGKVVHVSWPSIDNYSQRLAARLQDRHKTLSQLAGALQNVWLASRANRTGTEPPPAASVRDASAQNLRRRVGAFRASMTICERELEQPVYVFEKLDGTNVGVDDRGNVFGRRQVVQKGATEYMHTSLKCLPSLDQLTGVFGKLMDILLKDQPPSVVLRGALYGELMCNPGRYGYEEKGFARRWFCFGVRLWEEVGGEGGAQDEEEEAQKPTESLHGRLIENGFWVAGGLPRKAVSRAEKATVVLNDRLLSLLSDHQIPTTPLVLKGTMRDAVGGTEEGGSLGALLCVDKFEGVVVTSPSGLFKWKTSFEEESNGPVNLKKLIEKLGGGLGVEMGFLTASEMWVCERVLRVAEWKKGQTQTSKTKGAQKKTQKVKEAAKDKQKEEGQRKAARLEALFRSALSKYDPQSFLMEQSNGEKKNVGFHETKQSKETSESLSGLSDSFSSAAFAKLVSLLVKEIEDDLEKDRLENTEGGAQGGDCRVDVRALVEKRLKKHLT